MAHLSAAPVSTRPHLPQSSSIESFPLKFRRDSVDSPSVQRKTDRKYNQISHRQAGVTFETKLFGGIGALMLLALIVNGFGFSAIHSLSSTVTSLRDVNARKQ